MRKEDLTLHSFLQMDHIMDQQNHVCMKYVMLTVGNHLCLNAATRKDQAT